MITMTAVLITWMTRIDPPYPIHQVSTCPIPCRITASLAGATSGVGGIFQDVEGVLECLFGGAEVSDMTHLLAKNLFWRYDAVVEQVIRWRIESVKDVNGTGR
jgi:hypothetical protein